MSAVADFEAAFAEYVGAEYALALCNGTATLHTALVALGVGPGDKVAVPPLTMASTTIAVLHAGAVPVFVDVDPDMWLMGWSHLDTVMPVSLYGLHYPWNIHYNRAVDDAAQTIRPHNDWAGLTSYSFQASKILPLGEGGMLVTNDGDLAQRARQFSSLGYRMTSDGPMIDKAALKHPHYARHHVLGWNYRMSSYVASAGLRYFKDKVLQQEGGTYLWIDGCKRIRQLCADMYRKVVQDCEWLTPQHVPEGWEHDYWTYAVATDTPERCLELLDAVERHGGERPYPAWRLTYQEPAFHHWALKEFRGVTSVGWKDDEMHLPEHERMPLGSCPVAESLQPRLVQFQTNNLESAKRNASALRKAIAECT